MTKKPLQEKLNCDYPIFQAPMAGNIVSPEFVAKVCNFGFIGSIPSGYLSIEKTREFIQQVKSKTHKPFQLNIFVDYACYGDSPIKKPIEVFEMEKQYSEEALADFTIPPTPTTDEFIEVAVDCNVPMVSTTFGLLSQDHIKKLKSNNIKIINTINSVYELKLALQTQQPDLLVYQNSQAGGHKGGFTKIPHSTETEILAELSNHPDVYCVVAGGIVNKDDINNAINKGFDGVQIGTAFIATAESSAIDMHKQYILKHTETVFTENVTGKLARGLKNKITTLQVKDNIGFPYLFYATASLRKKARQQNDMQYQSFWCGDSINKINKISTLQHYMESLV